MSLVRIHSFSHAVYICFLTLGIGLMAAGCGLLGSEPVVPAAPTGLEALSGDGAVELDWEAVEEAEHYSVYRSTSSGVDPSGTPVAEGVSNASYTDGEVENGTTYYYRVTAVADEEGEASGEVEVTPFSDPPDRP